MLDGLQEHLPYMAATAGVCVPLFWAATRCRPSGIVVEPAICGASMGILQILPSNKIQTIGDCSSLTGNDSAPKTMKQFRGLLGADSAELLVTSVEKLRNDEVVACFVVRTQKQTFLEIIPVMGEELSGDGVLLFLRDVSTSHRKHLLTNNENTSMKDEVRRLSAVLNNATSLIWLRNAEFGIYYCNLPYTLAVEESAVEEDELGIPDLFANSRDMAAKARELGGVYRERRHLVVSGKRRYFQITETYLPDLDVTKGVAIDINELYDAQQQVQRYKDAQTDLIESSTSAIAIYGADARLQVYNQAYVQMWSYDEHWLDTSPKFGEVLEVLREKRRLPEQANFAAYKQQRLRVFTDILEPEEELHFLPDGRTIRSVAIPHRLGGVLLTYEDVTDRLALERSYNTLIAVQQETLDNLHEGVVVFGEDGRLRLTNPEFLKLWHLDEKQTEHGTHYKEVMGHLKELLPEEDWGRYVQEFVHMVQSRKLLASRRERADGTVLDWSMVPLPDGGTLLTYTDVTDSTLVERSLREKNDALQAADRLKSEFLANVSYELRSPLTSISGFAEMLRQDYFGELTEKQREYVEGIHGSAQNLMHIISDILDLASIEAGYMALDISGFDVHNMLQSVVSLAQERMREMHVHAEIECAKSIGAMQGDETRLRQVLFHLLSNAVKYSPEEGTVHIGAERQEDGVLLWVRDEGAGIAEDEREVIFDKFYRGKEGSAKSGGTGLGLSMVKSFIDLHGGRVIVDSNEGDGTTFTCVIPHNPPVTEEERQLLQLREALQDSLGEKDKK